MKKVIFLFFIIIVSSSCSIRKKMIYMQTPPSNEVNTFSPTIQNDDLLSIIVTSITPESTVPFNVFNNTFSTNTGYTTGAIPPPGYLVDNEGNINFPVIGKIHVAGLTRNEITNVLEKRLKEYIESPVVLVKVLNYKITVLGEVGHPGVFTIPNEKITILEALGLAGDISIYGVRKNVLIIRNENGEKKHYRIDLTNSDFMNSALYYLKQNDVIYVEPNKTKLNSTVINTSNASLIISTISILITTTFLLTK